MSGYILLLVLFVSLVIFARQFLHPEMASMNNFLGNMQYVPLGPVARREQGIGTIRKNGFLVDSDYP